MSNSQYHNVDYIHNLFMVELKINKMNIQHIIYEKDFVIIDNLVIDSGRVSQEAINTFVINFIQKFILLNSTISDTSKGALP